MHYRINTKINSFLSESSQMYLELEVSPVHPVNPRTLAIEIIKEQKEKEDFVQIRQYKQIELYKSWNATEIRDGYRIIMEEENPKPIVHNMVPGLGKLELFLANRKSIFDNLQPTEITNNFQRKNYNPKFFNYSLPTKGIVEIYCKPTKSDKTVITIKALLPLDKSLDPICDTLYNSLNKLHEQKALYQKKILAQINQYFLKKI